MESSASPSRRTSAEFRRGSRSRPTRRPSSWRSARRGCAAAIRRQRRRRRITAPRALPASSRQRSNITGALISLVDDAQRVDGGAFDVAVVYAGLGDNDQAFAWLDRAMDERSLLPMHHFGLIRELASDPRFDHVRDRMRIAQR
jgi:hypothetical protein